jgi:hypothetical protein
MKKMPEGVGFLARSTTGGGVGAGATRFEWFVRVRRRLAVNARLA